MNGDDVRVSGYGNDYVNESGYDCVEYGDDDHGSPNENVFPINLMSI